MSRSPRRGRSILILVALGFGVLAEVLGMHFIIGAFVAGLFFRGRDMERELYEDVEKTVRALTKGFLVSGRESLTVGIGMSARGAVELIIAGVALEAGLFSQPEPTPPVVSNLEDVTGEADENGGAAGNGGEEARDPQVAT